MCPKEYLKGEAHRTRQRGPFLQDSQCQGGMLRPFPASQGMGTAQPLPALAQELRAQLSSSSSVSDERAAEPGSQCSICAGNCQAGPFGAAWPAVPRGGCQGFRAQIQGFEESRMMQQQQELAQSCALLRLPTPRVLQPEFRAMQGRMAAHRERCQAFPSVSPTLHSLSPPCHVPPGSRAALCWAGGSGGIPPECVCWAGTSLCCLCFPRTCLSARVLVTSPCQNPLGINTKEWCWFPSTR